MTQATNTLVTNQIIAVIVLVIAVIVHAALNYLALGRQTNGLAAQNAHADAANQLAVKTTGLQADANHQATDATLHRWAPPVLAAAIRQLAADSGVTPDEVRASWMTYKAQALTIGAARLVGWFPTLKGDDARLLLEHVADRGGTLLTSALPTIEQMASPLLNQVGSEVAALPFNSLHIPPEVIQQAEAMAAGLIPALRTAAPAPAITLAPAPTTTTTPDAPQVAVSDTLHTPDDGPAPVEGTITPLTPGAAAATPPR